MTLTPDQLNVLLASTAVYSLVGGIVFCLAWHVTLGALVLVRDGALAVVRLAVRRPRVQHESARDVAL